MTGRVHDMILDPKLTGQLPEVIAEGGYYGMQTFDQHLLQHLEAGRITMEEAVHVATSPHDFKLMVAAAGKPRARARPRARLQAAARRQPRQQPSPPGSPPPGVAPSPRSPRRRRPAPRRPVRPRRPPHRRPSAPPAAPRPVQALRAPGF